MLGRSAAELQRDAQDFERSLWFEWRRLELPPAGAPRYLVAFFLARRSAPFPVSSRQWRRICSDIKSPSRVRKPRTVPPSIPTVEAMEVTTNE